MIAAIFSQDLRFAAVTFVLTLLQTLSPRWVPVARVVTAVATVRPGHRIGDLYFDLGGVRGAAAIALVVQGIGMGLVLAGHAMSGFLLLVLPTASFLMAPTLGFCSGCWFYVLGREWMVRRGWVKKEFDDAGDIAIARDDGAY